MIRRGRYKYIYSEPDPDLLYDLESDPNELKNLAGHPEFRELQSAFQSEVLARWDPQAIRRNVIASQQRRKLVNRALMTGRRAPWDFQPRRDASQQYMRNSMALDDLERRARFPAPEIPPPDLPLEGRG
jgi:choline-sulfatase